MLSQRRVSIQSEGISPAKAAEPAATALGLTCYLAFPIKRIIGGHPREDGFSLYREEAVAFVWADVWARGIILVPRGKDCHFVLSFLPGTYVPTYLQGRKGQHPLLILIAVPSTPEKGLALLFARIGSRPPLHNPGCFCFRVCKAG